VKLKNVLKSDRRAWGHYGILCETWNDNNYQIHITAKWCLYFLLSPSPPPLNLVYKYTRLYWINLLKPTVHVRHHQFNIQQRYILPTLYLCVLYLSHNK
jgi:hypothetical protein